MTVKRPTLYSCDWPAKALSKGGGHVSPIDIFVITRDFVTS